ncbi:MAG: hypothetical protein ACTHJJ_04320 [Intrasporangium sp.]|uniref:hypothetical protein n=1 Tax=Intrasporangium sp. TaxID=1925024 RepID=UPI003F7FA89C
MDMMGVISVGSGVLGLAALGLGIPAFVWVRRGELRAPERHEVEWELSWCGSGNFHVTNVGSDTARAVTARVEPSHGGTEDSGEPRDVAPHEMFTFELPDLPGSGLGGFAHASLYWETDLGTAKSVCQTLER